MTLQGMSNQTYLKILDETIEIQYLIIAAGGIATKTAVENILMRRHSLNRSDAHSFTNYAESRQDFMVRSGKVQWLAKRPQPTIEDWPEMAQEEIG